MDENNKSKTKKILFIILVIVIVVALGLIVYQYSGYKAGTEVQEGVEEIPPVSEETPPAAQGSGEIAGITDKAIRNQDASLCEYIRDENNRTICEDEVAIVKAISSGDPTLCENLNDETRIGECENKVTSQEQE